MLGIKKAGHSIVMRRFSRFIVVGIGNTIIGLGVIFSAKQMTDDVTANLIGYLIMVPLTFYFHRNITFKDTGRRLPAFGRYIVSISIGYLCNRLMLTWALSMGINAYISQILAIGSHVAVIYLLSLFFVFVKYETRSI